MDAFRAVVDASVAVKLCVPEALSEEAHAVFAQLSRSPEAELIVPDLFYIECANIFWKWVRRFRYPKESAQENLADLQRLDLLAIPTQAVAARALEIALETGVTAYDSCYVATAIEEGVPLITADRKLVESLRGTTYDVRWLGDMNE